MESKLPKFCAYTKHSPFLLWVSKRTLNINRSIPDLSLRQENRVFLPKSDKDQLDAFHRSLRDSGDSLRIRDDIHLETKKQLVFLLCFRSVSCRPTDDMLYCCYIQQEKRRPAFYLVRWRRECHFPNEILNQTAV